MMVQLSARARDDPYLGQHRAPVITLRQHPNAAQARPRNHLGICSITYTWGHLSCRGQISEEVGTQTLLFYFIRYVNIIYGIVISQFSSITGCLTSQQINHLDCLLIQVVRDGLSIVMVKHALSPLPSQTIAKRCLKSFQLLLCQHTAVHCPLGGAFVANSINKLFRQSGVYVAAEVATMGAWRVSGGHATTGLPLISGAATTICPLAEVIAGFSGRPKRRTSSLRITAAGFQFVQAIQSLSTLAYIDKLGRFKYSKKSIKCYILYITIFHILLRRYFKYV